METPTPVRAISDFTTARRISQRSNMKPSGITHQRLAAVFLLGCVLFNYPFLSLFNKPGEILDVPLLYIYIFAAWALLIGVMAYIIERRRE
jgi:peptidoglycan/LPS O-acetylase OafA/YrhL